MCISGINRVIVTARPVVVARNPENGHPGEARGEVDDGNDADNGIPC